MLKVFSKIGRIFLGWWYWATNQKNKLAQDRLKICVDCELYKWFVCTECGCPGQAKARIEEEKCPHPDGDKWHIHKWNYSHGFVGDSVMVYKCACGQVKVKRGDFEFLLK